MTFAHLLTDAARVAVVLAAALGVVRGMARASAAARRLVLVTALGAALAVPLVSAFAPSWSVGAPRVLGAIVARPFAEPLVQGTGEPASSVVRPEALSGAALARRWSWPTVLVVAWALGAACVAFRAVNGYARARRIVRRAAPADASWTRVMEDVMGRTRARLLVSADVDAPAVTGLFSSVVILPLAADEWNDARRRVVLLHERAHLERHDALAQLVAHGACALHWFDPLVWIAAQRLRVERELAADDSVIAAAVRPSSYAEHLLALAGVGLRASPRGALGMTEGERLAERVAAIVDDARSRAPVSGLRTSIVVTAAAAVVLAVACVRPGDRAVVASMPSDTPAPSSAAKSTIDARLQAIADDELARLAEELAPEAATVLVLDAATAEVRANAGRVSGAKAEVAMTRVFLPASTLKAITVAAALEEGAVTPLQQIDCGGGKRSYGPDELYDASENGVLPVGDVLAVSSNVGVSRIFDALGGERLQRWLHRFHFGERPRIDGVTAAGGMVPEHIESSTYDGAVAAIGQSIMASPLQVAAAYATFANEGIYRAPTLTRRTSAGERLLRADTAHALLAMLDGVVNGEHGTGKLARVEGVHVLGKTGSGGFALGGKEHMYGSFVGIVPAERPRFVVLVGVDGIGERYVGPKAAAPVFARVAARALAP